MSYRCSDLHISYHLHLIKIILTGGMVKIHLFSLGGPSLRPKGHPYLHLTRLHQRIDDLVMCVCVCVRFRKPNRQLTDKVTPVLDQGFVPTARLGDRTLGGKGMYVDT